jgi:hypothetical protein
LINQSARGAGVNAPTTTTTIPYRWGVGFKFLGQQKQSNEEITPPVSVDQAGVFAKPPKARKPRKLSL